MIHDTRKSARSPALHGPDGETGEVRHLRCLRVEGVSLEDARAITAQHRRQLAADQVLVIDYELDPRVVLGDAFDRDVGEAALRAGRHGSTLTLLGAGLAPLMDLCDLEAPLPLERILERASVLAPGEALAARTPCFPRPLFSLLDSRALDWEAVEDIDESAVVWVGRPG